MIDTKTPAPLPPLLSDEILAHLNCRCDNCVRRVAQVIEADHAKTREVVQALVDGIETMRQGAFADAFVFASDAELGAHADKLLALAKSQLNIEPTKP